MSLSGNEHRLHLFTGYPDGRNPIGLISLAGKLYGETYLGGAHRGGTIYEIDAAGNEHVLHSFSVKQIPDGINPSETLLAVDGDLYGTTDGGAVNPCCGYGTVSS
jgi:uncharacterized repeat protein (TIGR03803 family)